MPLTWPNLIQADPGRELIGAFTQLLIKLNRDQGIGESINRTLDGGIFGHQYAQELLLAKSSKRSTEWVRCSA